ncbi:FxsA family protein [Blastococcus sp. CT_GayMR20]|uniref:FxsA family protein n=1 Tax=Blastococcus sp. CT_GayMR20 TaxID=2559609 RepID=UPI001073852E|nr:FxsA family protein [Blastococcus sp. CT_GayMR20]TFV87874.1 FxsA family protein [Blastococcus sp. CT_GayMR20]
MSDVVGRRVRLFAGLLVLAELIVFVLVAAWIGLGWTILATLATSVIGWILLARQGTRALADLRDRARSRQPAGRELGDAGLVAAGGLLMVLPGFIGDVVGLLCLLPGTRSLVRGALTSVVLARLPDRFRGPVRARSVRVEQVGGYGSGSTRAAPLVIEGEVVRDTPPERPAP